MSTRAMAATSHPLATASALAMLRDGGSAMDAAVAAAAVLAVVEPYSTGVGGDCFLLYHHARSKRLYGLNGSGRAGSLADAEHLRRQGLKALPEHGAMTVTVPGAVAAWAEAIERFGRMPLSWVLQPAIVAAEDGFAVTPVIAAHWQRDASALAAEPETAAVYLETGAAPRAGSVHHQPELARSLRQIAEGGAEAFYRGPLAAAMVDCVAGLGGFLQAEDLRRHRSRWVEPVSTDYHGLQVFELPPNGQGVTALLLLNMLEQSALSELGFGSAEHIHRVSEAFRLARRQRDRWLGDPDFSEIPVGRLLSKAFATELLAMTGETRLAEARLETGAAHKDTVYLCVVDEHGNVASLINSLFHAWGSRLTVPGTGILLHNRGAGFNLQEGHPNCLQAGKRPLHTIIPAMAYQAGRPVLAFGVMGGHYQALGHAWVLSAWRDFGMDVQSAVDAPRFFPTVDELQLERGFSPDLIQPLRQRGHRVRRVEETFGGAQMIALDPDSGVLTGGSDPRKDGCALGF